MKSATAVGIRRLDWLTNLALLLTSTVFALGLSEAALRLMGRGPLKVSPERDRFWKHDSLLGWAHRPGQDGTFETPQFRISVRINRQGLRDREHTYERATNAGRILVLGDSFAWGYGVEKSDRFSQRLEALLGVEVINAGVSGYSTDQELLWFREEGVKYDVDLVIVVVAGNDIGDNSRSLVHNIYYKPRFVTRAGRLVLTGTPVPQTNPQGRSIYFLSQRSALAYFLVQRYFDLHAVYRELRRDGPDAAAPAPSADASPDGPFDLTIALLDEMRGVAASHGAGFMVVATDRWWNGPPGATHPDFVAALRAKGFRVLNVEAMPGFDPGSMVIPDDGHWNAAGHDFVARRIAAAIQRHRLLGPPRALVGIRPVERH